MSGSELINLVFNGMSRAEQVEAREEMVDILKGYGWYVMETDDELREMALTETDLLDPEDGD